MIDDKIAYQAKLQMIGRKLWEDEETLEDHVLGEYWDDLKREYAEDSE